MAIKKESASFKFSVESSIKDEMLKEMSIRLENESERRRLSALFVCFFSVAFDLLLGIAAFVCAAVTRSSAGYAFALDCVLDAVAAALVLWRFYGVSSTHSETKEAFACSALGVLFCMASIGIVTKSTYDLAFHTIPQKLVYIFILAGIGGFVNSFLCLLKYFLGKKMKSKSLILEAVNTALSAFLALMLAMSDVLFYYFPAAWSIDAITSIITAFILMGCGISVLRNRRRSNGEATPLLVNGKVTSLEGA